MSSKNTISRSRSRSPVRGVKLHVKKLPIQYSEEALYQVFSVYGEIQDVRMIRKGSNGQPLRESVYGFVEMSSRESAELAIEALSARGWSVSFSRQTPPRPPPQSSSHEQPLLSAPGTSTPSDRAFLENMQATNMLLLSSPDPIERLLAEHHPNASNMESVPEQFKPFLLVREIWVGNVAPSTEKQQIFQAFKEFGQIEGIEVFSAKAFAFIKFRKVESAVRAYECGVKLGNRPTRITFADPKRRIDILGDAAGGEMTDFNPLDEAHFKTLFLGYPPGAIVPPESKLREVFSRYGQVHRIAIRQATPTTRPYSFVDFAKGDQAAEARRELYLQDTDGSRRRELGDPGLEISFKNSHNIVSKPKPRDAPVQRAPSTTPAQPNSSYPYHYSGLPTPSSSNVQSTADCTNEVVWSGFMSRSKLHRVGIDANLVSGSADCFPATFYHINISNSVQIQEVAQFKVIAVFVLQPSNDTQMEAFKEYVADFSEKERAGHVTVEELELYVCPPLPAAKEIHPGLSDGVLLGVFVDPTQKVVKNNTPVDPRLAKRINALSLIIKAKTWARDSYNLYDYESRNCLAKQLQTNDACKLVRSESNVQLVTKSTEEEDCTVLAVVEKRTDEYFLSAGQEPLWHIVKQMKKGAILVEGDVLKLGRVCLRVKRIMTEHVGKTQAGVEGGKTCHSEFPSQSDLCRICLSEHYEDSNPLIAPCMCLGSVKYIHLSCLQRWIDSRKEIKQSENAINFYWKSMDCELCKQPYPDLVSLNGQTFPVHPFESPAAPFIVLEPVDSQRGAGLYCVSFINNCVVKIGRGHDADIRISDISVSRLHATIRYQDGSFVLEDNNSKFGSLLMVKGSIPIPAYKTTHVQIGRTIIAVGLK